MSAPTDKITFAVAANEALDEAMAIDPTVILLGEDIADGQGGGVAKVTSGLSTKYGTDRVRTTPISEQAIIGSAIGAAISGFRPVAEIMLMNFVGVAMDQIVNHAAKLRFMSGGQTGVPMTIRTTTGPGLGFGGQHSDMLEAWFAHTPGMKVVVPSTVADAKALLTSCVFDDDPCLFIEPSLFFFGGVKGPAPAPGYVVPLGLANVEREGTDITLLGYGRMMAELRTVADRLAVEGHSVELVDLRTVSPFDRETVLNSVGKTKRLVIAHEAVRAFGVGAEIASVVNEELFGELATPVRRLGSRFSPVPVSSPLEQALVPSADNIFDVALASARA